MPEALEIDVDQLMERLRENTWTRRSEVSPPNAHLPLSQAPLPADFAGLQSNGDICHIDFTSHRKVVGRLVVFVKNVLRQLLTPILERQYAFNAAIARAATFVWEQVEGMRQQQAAATQELWAEIAKHMEATRQQQAAVEQTLRQELEALRQEHAAVLQELRTEMLEHVQAWGRWGERMETRLGGMQQDLSTRMDEALSRLKTDHNLMDGALTRLKTDQILQERRLTVLLEEARKRLPDPLSPDQLRVFADEGQHMLDALYVSFEDQFRGTREEIKERFRVYLPLLKEAKLGSARMPILDVGCGRGEWLELLQEEGLQAQGVDLNRVLLEGCRARGLAVTEGEAIAYFSTLPSSSVGAVTGFHVIEHLPFDALIRLLDEAVRVLKPGGVAIFETPNPENVLVGSCNFYLDPTHRNPLPSAMVKFLVETRGLCRVEVMNLHPYPQSCRVEAGGLAVTQRFNEYFYGPQDYAVVGWKV